MKPSNSCHNPLPSGSGSFCQFAFDSHFGAKAELKHRYLKSDVTIAGDHEKALQARKLFDYYQDLVTKLSSKPVWMDSVGHTELELFVDLAQ